MEPRIKVIARPVLDLSVIEAFLDNEGTKWRRDPKASPPEELVEFAGRICYVSFGRKQSPKTNAQYIHNLILQGHESVLEHASWTFLVTGVSRAFSHQFVRHRVGFSYSQLSQQYVDQEQVEFIEPIDLDKYPEVASYWREAVESIRKAYTGIKDVLNDESPGQEVMSKRELTRFVRSAARSILPNATETKLVFSANARALRHFLRLRGGIEGDLEMRKVSAQLLSLMQNETPALFCDFCLDKLDDGTPIVRTTPAHR